MGNHNNNDHFKCSICSKQFTSFSGLASHKKWKHECPKSYECEECQTSYRDSFILKRHIRTVHRADSKRANNYLCPLCLFRGNKNRINNHFSHEHGVDLNIKTFHFENINEFNNWKEKMERDTCSKYVKHRPSRQNKDGSQISVLYCHRDGHFRSEGKQLRSLKALGSNKINAHCPSMIEIKISSGVNVKFIQAHVGHSNDVSRLRLSKKEKEAIAKKISNKVPMDDILDSIRDSLSGDFLQRIHLTTKKDIFNIISQFQLNKGSLSSKKSSSTLESWIEKINSKSSLIKLFKPDGVSSITEPELKSEDFCLIIANEFQIEMLKKYGNDVICIDRVGASEYFFDLELFTVIVLDDKRQAFPSAFMFCNRNDSKTMEIYFKILKYNLKTCISPRYLMSDLAESYFNGWSSVFPSEETKRIFCSWHVDKVWRDNLKSTVNSEEKQVEIYTKIKELMFEKDSTEFSYLSEQLLIELYSNRETLVFGSYIEKFIRNPSPWAFSHYWDANINSNSSLESLHNNLKYIFSKGKKSKELDKGIQILMKFIREKLYCQLILTNSKEIPHKLSCVKLRHKASLLMADSSVVKVDESTWNILSSKGKVLHTVISEQCSCLCGLRCPDCDCCIHNFKCTCSDSVVAWNICKHIHLVCRVCQIDCSTEVEFELQIESNEYNDGGEIFILKPLNEFEEDKESINENGPESFPGIVNILHESNSEGDLVFTDKVILLNDFVNNTEKTHVMHDNETDMDSSIIEFCNLETEIVVKEELECNVYEIK